MLCRGTRREHPAPEAELRQWLRRLDPTSEDGRKRAAIMRHVLTCMTNDWLKGNKV